MNGRLFLPVDLARRDRNAENAFQAAAARLTFTLKNQNGVDFTHSGWYKTSDKKCFRPRFYSTLMPEKISQRDLLRHYMSSHNLARARELRNAGIMPSTLSRAVGSGELLRISRGLYQGPESGGETDINLAEVTSRAPRAVICLVSALAWHNLTDQLPRKVWFAIGSKDWSPRLSYPPVRVVRFREPYYSEGVETHHIGGTDVRIYSVAKSLADAFRNPGLVDRSVAIESLKAALDQRKARPAELLAAASRYGAAKVMAPYLEALTSNG